MSKCNICSKKEFIELFKATDYKTLKQFSILECQNCSLAFTYPRLNKQNLLKYYKGYRDDSNKRFSKPIEELIYFWHKRRVRHIKKLVNKGEILDVGCGRGLELEMLRRDGWSAYATEFSEDLGRHLIKKGIKPFFKGIWALKGKNNFFDVITLWSKVIKSSRKLLKKEGYLIIEVPNFSSLERNLFGALWFHLDVPRHLYHFPKETLRILLEDNNYKIISEKHFAPEYDFFSFWQGSLNKIFPNYPYVLYRFLLKDERVTNLEKAIVAIQIPLAIMLVFVSILVVPFLWLTKQSGTIEFTAQKVS